MERSTWIKLADKTPDEPEVAGLSDAAFRLHITALCYCSRHLTDGLIPDAMIGRWGVRAAQRAANELVEAGLWSWRGDGDYAVVGYLETQRSRAEVEALSAKRADAGKRGGYAKARAKQAAGNLPSKDVAENRDRDTEAENNTSAVAAVADRPEVLDLCEHLADLIEANGSKRPNVGKGWLDACRLMIDRDGRSPEQIRRAIDWCQGNEFWRANVLSMPKLREQYDTLRLQAQRTPAQDRGERQAESYRNLREQMAALDEADARAAGRAIGAGE